jgi:hypothetical protein
MKGTNFENFFKQVRCYPELRDLADRVEEDIKDREAHVAYSMLKRELEAAGYEVYTPASSAKNG